MPSPERRSVWKYVRVLAPPVLVLAGLVAWQGYSLALYFRAGQEADESNLREWVNESIPFRKTLPQLVREYIEIRLAAPAASPAVPGLADKTLEEKMEEIREHLRALGNPLRIHQGLLPLFPNVYGMRLEFAPGLEPSAPLSWDSYLPRPQSAAGLKVRSYPLLGEGDNRVTMVLEYQLHAYEKEQQYQRDRQRLLLGIGGLVLLAVILAGAWVYFFLRKERERELESWRAEQQIEHAEKLVLENELRRQEAETRQQETERKLLVQSLEAARMESRASAAEKQALELKSQFYASIGIMAGSYAHNIKNLLVRPNDLIRRCLEADGLSTNQGSMLHEVRETLGTVTERLQQILRTVRRDPSTAELTRLDLNNVVRDIQRTWTELAREKWKLTIQTEIASGPLEIDGDLSHLQQAVENLLFNARDATFEMRNHMRDQAHLMKDEGGRMKDEKTGHAASSSHHPSRRQAVLAAAAWKGTILLRTRRDGDWAVLEVRDNGIGMTDEVRRRCIETHFSTKRDNALYEGYNAGMGLGLSFVTVIMEHHHADMTIESEPLHGALFRVRFPLATPSTGG